MPYMQDLIGVFDKYGVAVPPHMLAQLGQLLPTTESGLPVGVNVVDETNGLVSADPVVFGNPDLKGQYLSALQTKAAFTGQGAATIQMNADDAKLPGIHTRVWPMVDNGDGTYSRAPEVGEGTHATPPWLDDAWLINPNADLATALREFRVSTFIPAVPPAPPKKKK